MTARFIMSFVTFALVVGCQSQHETPRAAGVASRSPTLAEATGALSRMVQISGADSDDANPLLNDLRHAPVQRERDGTITIGRWSLDLEDRKFVWTHINTHINPPMFHDLSGEFRVDDAGNWVAVKTRERQT